MPSLATVPFDRIPLAATPQRILFFSKTQRYTRAAKHFIRGFKQNGHRVLRVNFTKIRKILMEKLAGAYVKQRIALFRPELVLIHKKDVPMEIFDALPGSIPKAVFYEDAFEPDVQLLEIARRCSVIFTTGRLPASLIKRLALPPVMYVKTGCDWIDHHPVKPDLAYAAEVAFIGSASSPERISLLRAISGRFPLRVYGKGWRERLGWTVSRRRIYPSQYRKVCSSTKIMIGIDYRSDIELGFSNRTWLTLGCGGFLLTQYVPGLEEVFVNHKHLVWYRSFEECLDLIAYYLPRDAERERIAATGCYCVRTYHTFRHATVEIVAHMLSGDKIGHTQPVVAADYANG